ncbi:solute carrier organic anion transporter family member 4A1-like [Mytilus californianus]|uniref:solute carrier organic anion transporter family member 4A1-like n=1 Tax=Mytilus californianus TaxID=6549 RepID=UPI0022485AF9|nr:solute carrier organic anion transporter family member 4A1-like [Mytilus californianus]
MEQLNGIENKGFENGVGCNDVTVEVKTDITKKNGIPSHDNGTLSTYTSNPENTKIDKRDISEDLDWGYGPFKPRCFQVFNKMHFYILFVSIMCFIEGFAVNGIANSAIPSLERQFKLPSTKSALIPSSMDIGSLIVVLFVTFIGGRYNKAAIVAGGTVVMALGSFVFLIPHFIDQYTYVEYATEYTYNCSAGSSWSSECDPVGESYLAIFMIANMLHGVGFTTMFTLGSAYIDDNEDNAKAALHIGLTFSASAVGTAVGFLSGGEISQNYYVEFDRVDTDSIGITFIDQRWVGAWWLGFAISIVAFAIIAVPLFGFPKRLPGVAKRTDEKECENSFMFNVKKFFVVLITQIKNPIFMMVTFAGTANTLAVSGVGSFAYKFLMEQYNLDYKTAGYLLAGMILVGVVGTFGGGVIIRIFNLELRGMLRLAFVSCLVSSLMGISFIAGCPDVKLAGLEVPYHNHPDVSNGYSDACQKPCQCQYETFTPVCGIDNVVYYSPCHAGCTSVAGMGVWGNCSCIAQNLNISQANAGAFYGRCDDNCDKLYYVAPCIFLAIIFVLISTTPNSMCIMRVVDEDVKPFALGVEWVFIRLLGTIPGPLLVGWVLDNACLIFLDGTCGNKGNCLLYSHDDMASGILIWWLIVSLLSAIFYLFAILFEARSGKSNSFELSSN